MLLTKGSIEMKEKMEKMEKGGKKEGIGRVMQRPGDMEVGQGGKMNQKPREKSDFNRDAGTTPRKA